MGSRRRWIATARAGRRVTGLLYLVADADVSPCGRYRYALRRVWRQWPGWESALDLWVLLNPSTADGSVDDPTVRKCRGFSARDGAAGFMLVNPYAWRATSPGDLWRAEAAGIDIVGPYNDEVIAEAARTARRVIVGWGSNAAGHGGSRWARVFDLLRAARPDRQVWAYGVTKDGHPRHPLMTGYDMPATLI
jgi:hypothetical protein